MLDCVRREAEIGRMINVGCGEGDVDREFCKYSAHLVACDLSEEDIAQARGFNMGVAGIAHLVANAQELPFDDESFDVACCIEVIEHVADPRACLRELARVVRAGGAIILTCPSARFPLAYDPLNWMLSRVGKHASVGAFGYGHSWLVREEDLTNWACEAGLGLVESVRLSKTLVSLFEAYWPGLVQRIVKVNAKNRGAPSKKRARATAVRPTHGKPPFLPIVDALIDADHRLFGPSQASIGLGFLFKKGHRD